MARRAGTYSRLSVGAPYHNSALTLGAIDAGDTGTTFSWDGGAAGDALTLSSTLSVAGQVTATSGAAVGGGAAVTNISTVTAALTFGAVAGLGTSSILTVGISGATRGDSFVINPDATFLLGTNMDLITFQASSGSTTGEVSVWAINSAQSSITPTAATVFRVTRIGFGSFV